MQKVFNPYAEEALLPFFCLAVTALFAELMAVAVFYESHNPPLAIILHSGVIWVLLLFTYHAYGWGKSRLFLFLLAMIAATGPFGASICLLAAIVYTLSPRASLSPDEWINSFLEDAGTSEHELLHDRLGLGLENILADSKVEPFHDILNSGTTVQKQIAISRMMKYFRPQFAPLLLRAAQDSNAVVRVQAATAMAKIEHDFMAKYMRLKKSLKDAPENSSVKLDFARICDSYAHAGLLDEASIKGLRMQAIEIYTQYLESNGDPEIKLRLARLYLRDNQPEKTCGLLHEPVKSGEATPAMVFWYMEALFRLKKFAQLRLLISRYAPALKKFPGYKPQAETLGLLSVWKNDNLTDGETYAA
jgi:hypothetical protein